MDSVPTAHDCGPPVAPRRCPGPHISIALDAPKSSKTQENVTSIKSMTWTRAERAMDGGANSLRERLRSDYNQHADKLENRRLEAVTQRLGTTFIWRSASILASSGGWVLKSDEIVPRLKTGLTMQSEDVEGEIAVVGMRLL